MFKIGVIGTGQMAATMVQAMTHLPALSPVAVLSGDLTRAQAFARRFRMCGAYEAQETFLEQASLDAVYIANANTRHFATAQACLKAGLPVFIEKPMGLDLQEVEALQETAQQRDLLLLENLWILALPAYRALKTVVENGSLGAAHMLSFDFSLPVTAKARPGLFASHGGGVLRDRAVYGLAVALDLLGAVRDVSAALHHTAEGVETRAVLQLTHECGANSQISVSFDTGGRNDLCVGLERGAIHLRHGLAAEYLQIINQPPATKSAEIIQIPGMLHDWKQVLKRSDVLRRLKTTRSTKGTRFYAYGASPYLPMLQAFATALEQSQTENPIVPADMSRKIAQLVMEMSS